MVKHNPVVTESGWKCQVCNRTWKEEPDWFGILDCPGMPGYGWGMWPENLLTKKQMNEASFQTGKKLPAPAGLVYRKKSPGGKMFLYDKNQGVPKRSMSEAQIAALAKAQAMSKPVDVRCLRCREILYTTTAKRAAALKPRLCSVCKDHFSAVNQALKWLEEPFLMLDFETTGLDTDDQIIQAGIIDQDGEVLLDTMIKPTCSISDSAMRVHHITEEIVATAPSFVDVYPHLAEVLTGKTVIIYNAEFDVSFLYNDCRRNKLAPIQLTSRCAMRLYAKYVGEWSTKYQDYRYQPMPYGDHTAVGDCRGTLRLLNEMAEDKEPEWAGAEQSDA